MEETTAITENTFNKEEFDSFVKDALIKIEEIKGLYKRLFEAEEGKQSIVLEIETSLKNLKKEYENLFSNEAGISKVSEINAQLEEIKNYHKELLQGDDSIKSDIKESQDKITDFYVYLFGGTDGDGGQEKTIREVIEKITAFNFELIKEDGYQKSIEDVHKRIMDLYEELFTKGELEESKVERLNKEIKNIRDFNDKIETEIKGSISGIKIDMETKLSEINSLLSHATVSSLAQGYLESMQNHGFTGLRNIKHHKDGSKKEIITLKIINWFLSFFRWLQNLFINLFNYILFISPLLLIGIIFIEPNFVKDFLKMDSLGGTNLIGTQYIFYKISISIPLLWISWYGQKNISYRKRLFEEYNHKLRVVQMYLLFISKNESYHIDNMTRLEEILLNVIDRNPVEVYGKDETMIDKIIDIIKVSKGITNKTAEKIKNTTLNVE